MDILITYPELDEFYMANNTTMVGSNTEPVNEVAAIQKNLDEKWVQLIQSDVLE
jgi:hypothetical protein